MSFVKPTNKNRLGIDIVASYAKLMNIIAFKKRGEFILCAK